jgi:hypothetical protein
VRGVPGDDGAGSYGVNAIAIGSTRVTDNSRLSQPRFP